MQTLSMRCTNSRTALYSDIFPYGSPLLSVFACVPCTSGVTQVWCRTKESELSQHLCLLFV